MNFMLGSWIMKKLLAIIALSLCLITPSQADDIRDFQIEGMSVGDSLLDYLSKVEIKNRTEFHLEQGNNKEMGLVRNIKNSETYLYINASFKTTDKNYTIRALSAFVDINFKIKNCFSLKKNIVAELEELFKNTEVFHGKKQKHSHDKTSYTYPSAWYFKGKSEVITVQCYDWSKKSKYNDQLRIEIVDSEYYQWLSSLL